MLQMMVGHDGAVLALDCGNNMIASASADATVRLWDASTGQCVHILSGHGDDVTAVGRRGAVRDLRAAMEGKWSVKVRAVLGPRLDDDRRITILGRGVNWRDRDAVEYGADPAHRKAILKGFDLE